MIIQEAIGIAVRIFWLAPFPMRMRCKPFLVILSRGEGSRRGRSSQCDRSPINEALRAEILPAGQHDERSGEDDDPGWRNLQ